MASILLITQLKTLKKTSKELYEHFSGIITKNNAEQQIFQISYYQVNLLYEQLLKERGLKLKTPRFSNQEDDSELTAVNGGSKSSSQKYRKARK